MTEWSLWFREDVACIKTVTFLCLHLQVFDGAVIVLSLAPMVASTVANGPSSPWDAISLIITLRIWRVKRIIDGKQDKSSCKTDYCCQKNAKLSKPKNCVHAGNSAGHAHILLIIIQIVYNSGQYSYRSSFRVNSCLSAALTLVDGHGMVK